MKTEKCCCFTGHRPEKLHAAKNIVLQKLDAAIITALRDGYTTFISGMAKGVDYEKRKVMRSEVLDAAQENSRERNHFA